MASRIPDGDGRHERLQRLWWAAPGALVAGSAIGVAVVVGPTLGQQVGVPRQLVVPATATVPSHPATAAPERHHPRPTPSTSTWSSPSAPVAPTTRVVQPRRHIVTASTDDSHESRDSSTEHESGDR